MKRILCRWLVIPWLACCAYGVAAQPNTPASKDLSAAAIGAIIADRHVADSAFEVHRRAAVMAAAQRYEYLANWVLPNESHKTFRVSADFTPTFPAPPVSDNDPKDLKRIEFAKARGQTRVATGGNLVSPVRDLISVARQLDKLDEVRARILEATPNEESQQRAKWALLAMVDIARGDFEAAMTALDSLDKFIEANPNLALWDRCPEILAIEAAAAHRQTRDFARDAAGRLYVGSLRTPRRGIFDCWETCLSTLLAAIRACDRAPDGYDFEKALAELSLDPPLAEWTPVSRPTAFSRGRGAAPAHWQRSAERVENVTSHEQDFLYYRVPLQGNFQVECDLLSRNLQNTQLIVGGKWIEPHYYMRSRIDVGDFRERLSRWEITPPLNKFNDACHLRVTVQDGVITHHVNGREIHRAPIEGAVDPWVVVRSENRNDGSAIDVRITGNPTIPEELRLTATADLAGWISYYPGGVAVPKATWQQAGDLENGGGINAYRRRDMPGVDIERLISYHRPMLENGVIEYEFLYREGESHAHPALDRLTFLLEPSGVRIHWLTDGHFDRTELPAGNVFDEPANRRGPEKLPLIENDWNRMRLTLEGDVVSLHLNDQLIYQRELEITNQRHFGLFHYSDRTELHVRNVRWRGDWPRQIRPVVEQELVNPKVRELDAKIPELTAVFEHDFVKEGMASEKLSIPKKKDDRLTQVPAGVQVVRTGGSGYFATIIGTNVIAGGDFDVTAEFEQFDPHPSENAISTAGLRINTSATKAQQCLVLRRLVRESRQEDKQVAQAVVRNGASEATLDWRTLYSDAQEWTAGKVRFARRGSRAYYLIAEGNSDVFRIVGESDVSPDDLPAQGIQLLNQSSGPGFVRVVWKNVVIRAERLTQVADSSGPLEQTLAVMNTDGSGLRQILPKDSGVAGTGSPAWSPDGKKIAFDFYNGSTANSRMYVINLDGTGLLDLGNGNMPTFSPDGKRIAYSWAPNRIVVMNIDGSNRQVLDENGWGAQWSPDGRIAFARGNNIVVMDPRTKSQRTILEPQHAANFSSVYWNMAWSRDGKQICFKGRNRKSEHEIAVVNAEGSRHGFSSLLTSTLEVVADFTWHPDGNRILFPMRTLGGLRLFTLDRSKPGQPQMLPGQPMDHFITGMDWSPDGKQIVFSSQVMPTVGN